MKRIFKQALLVSLITFLIDYVFHYFFTNPMETLTYFVIKLLLSFFVATWLFSINKFENNNKKSIWYIIIFGLLFSTLMSTYYRAWELGEAGVPFGSRAPDIIGIARDSLLAFSGTWWLGHAIFFAIGAMLARKLKGKND